MVDTWATVGSCAQIGRNVHLSGGVGIGGVLEPLQASPTIIEDDCFIGARSEVVEGVVVEAGAVISMGVVIGQSTRIYDRTTGTLLHGRVPAGSVVVSRTLPSADGGYRLYCAVIVKRVDAQADAKTSLNALLHGDGACDAQALLLAAREPGARAAQAVLHLIPQPRARQARAHDVIELRAAARQAMDVRTVGDVVVDRFRKRVRFLEHHADAGAQLRGVLTLIVDVAAVQPDRAGDARARDRIVHAIQAAQERRLAAPGRADHRQHLAARDVQGDVLQRLLGAVEHTHVAAREQRILDPAFRAARRRVSRRGRMHPAAGLEVQPTLPDTLPRDTLRGGDAVAAPRSRGARGRGPLRLRRRRILSRILR